MQHDFGGCCAEYGQGHSEGKHQDGLRRTEAGVHTNIGCGAVAPLVGGPPREPEGSGDVGCQLVSTESIYIQQTWDFTSLRRYQ